MILQAFGLTDIMAMTGSSQAKKSAKAVDVEKSVGQVEHVENSVNQDEHLPMSIKRFMSLTAMAFLWTGSQIPVYLLGSVPYYVYADIGGEDRWIWFVIANLLALASVCPFVGSMSDLMGRRNVAIFGASLIIVGITVASTAHEMNVFIAGMAIEGAGAGINELTALAVTSELAPTRQRGKYVAILVFTILPFCPSTLWAQLITSHSSWRYCGVFCGAWATIGLIMTIVFYFPPPRVNSQGLTQRQLLSRIDFVGGALSIPGVLLFMMGLQWGGYQYAWSSLHVLLCLLLGLALILAFIVWEAKFAKYPMFPARLKRYPRTLYLTLVITFISGANFFAALLFWPSQAYNVYGHDPIGVGLRGLPLGFAVLTGATIVLWLLSVFRGHNRELMVVSSCIMTAGVGSLGSLHADTLHRAWGFLVLAGLGIGGIVVPASIISTIICPDDLIATIAALTLAVRVLGGSVAYAIYYNVFVNQFVPNTKLYIGGAMETKLGITNTTAITEAIIYTGTSLLEQIKTIPEVANSSFGADFAYETIVTAGQVAYAESYRYIYLVSIAFGVISIIASLFLGNIDTFMDDHVAVVM